MKMPSQSWKVKYPNGQTQTVFCSELAMRELIRSEQVEIIEDEVAAPGNNGNHGSGPQPATKTDDLLPLLGI